MKEEKRIIKYGFKKRLSVGLVSCIAGCCIFLGSGVSAYAQSSWDTRGNVALGDKGSEVNAARHSVKVSTSIDEQHRTVTYTINFNANHELWRRPGIDAFLPDVIDLPSIRIQREYKESGGIWLKQADEETLQTFDAGKTRRAIWYTDTQNFNNDWARLQRTGNEQMSELNTWKDQGKFSIFLHSWEGRSTKQYKWTVTANLKEGVTVVDAKEAPVVVGISNFDGGYPRYVGTGPHDTDGDGYSDIREIHYGTDPGNGDDQPTAARLFDLRKPDPPVEVEDKTSLTPGEKEEVKAAIRAKNPALPQDAEVEVGDDGKVTVTYGDRSKDELPGSEVVAERPRTQAELNDVAKPDPPVEVEDKTSLTPGEKEEVKAAIRAKNPALPQDAEVEVGDDGKVTVTYGDRSKDELPGSEVVKEKEATPVDPTTVDTDGDGLSDAKEAELGTNPNEKDTDHDGFTDKEEVDKGSNPLDASSKPITKKPVVISGADTVRKQSELPQTGGSTNIFGYVATLLASAGALISIGKKKKKEYEAE